MLLLFHPLAPAYYYYVFAFNKLNFINFYTDEKISSISQFLLHQFFCKKYIYIHQLINHSLFDLTIILRFILILMKSVKLCNNG